LAIYNTVCHSLVLCAAHIPRTDQVRHNAGVPMHGEWSWHHGWALLLLEAGWGEHYSIRVWLARACLCFYSQVSITVQLVSRSIL